VRALTRWTAGLVGDRDPAQPLLTLLDGPARVELSGATTANWVAKSANLLVDGLGGPQRVGLLLPLHWQSVVLVLAGVTTGARVVVAGSADRLGDCEAVFTTPERAQACLDAGADEVLAVSTHPLGAPPSSVPLMVVDHAREIPSYGDHWGGAAPSDVDVVVAGEALGRLPRAGLGPDDRVLADLSPEFPPALRALLGALAEGAALVLAPGSGRLDLRSVAAEERLTASLGVDVPGVRRLL
jgi:uncharacterized protein (TIGR03089 family)